MVILDTNARIVKNERCDIVGPSVFTTPGFKLSIQNNLLSTKNNIATNKHELTEMWLLTII